MRHFIIFFVYFDITYVDEKEVKGLSYFLFEVNNNRTLNHKLCPLNQLVLTSVLPVKSFSVTLGM